MCVFLCPIQDGQSVRPVCVLCVCALSEYESESVYARGWCVLQSGASTSTQQAAEYNTCVLALVKKTLQSVNIHT